MRRSNDFSLFIISGVPYLLPFGQGIADLKRGVRINDTGIYLWELLSKDRTEDEILSLCAAHYEIPDSQLPQIKTDLQQYLHTLDSYGILKRFDHDTANISVSGHCTHMSADVALPFKRENTANDHKVPTDMAQRCLSIGGLTLLLRGPGQAFSQDFDAFEIFPDPAPLPHTDRENSLSRPLLSTAGTDAAFCADQTVTVTEGIPAQCPKSRILIKNEELTVLESDSQYILLFPAASGIHEARLAKDGKDARYYCCPPYTEIFRQDLFHAIRISFLYLAQLHGMVALHSASLLYQGRAWLFSGHSGAGKSTHTNLWRELYDVPLLNGDLNLLSMRNGSPTIHGLPWCGTSGIADTHSYPLGGILLVKKALQNYVTVPDDSQRQLLVAQRLISPAWTEALLQKNLSLVAGLAPHILICRLHCTKTPEAVETGKKAIDDYLRSRACL